MLHAESLAFSQGAQVVLSDVTLTVGPGDRLAVVGPNGVGKSTLLRLLAGQEVPESGATTAVGSVGLLPQERDLREDESVLGYLARRTGVAAASRELEDAAQALSADPLGAQDRYSTALETFLAIGGADLADRAGPVCAELGIPENDCPVSALSGGQAARLALAAIMLARFDVLLLDEPSNDLDLAGLALLEAYLMGLRGGLVLVSHDRELLRATATGVLSLDPHTRAGTVYGGGYDAYLTEVGRDRDRRQREYDDYAARRGELEGQARRQKEWSRQGTARANSAAARAREPDKNIRYFRQQGAQHTGARAAAALRKLDRLDQADEPRKEWQLRLRFGTAQRGSDMVATLSGAVAQRGGFRLGPVDLQLSRGDRVAVVGPNGSGKSTLVDVIAGRLPLAAGIASLGAGVILGEMRQARSALPGEAPLLHGFGERTGLADAEARTLLAKFGLGADDVLRPAATLSPGERTRAGLALLVHSRANLLILDEPTNHLDLAAITQLEQALGQYGGTLLLITHDRRLLKNVGITRRIAVAGGEVSS